MKVEMFNSNAYELQELEDMVNEFLSSGIKVIETKQSMNRDGIILISIFYENRRVK